MRIARISRDSLLGVANLAIFAQFAVKFEGSISRCLNRKMVGEFRVIC